jgi:hypothetical protein
LWNQKGVVVGWAILIASNWRWPQIKIDRIWGQTRNSYGKAMVVMLVVWGLKLTHALLLSCWRG